MATLVVHDRRLTGGTPSFATESMLVNGATPTSTIVNFIKSRAATHGRIENLYVMCHGIYNSHHAGGFGLQLGAEGIRASNLWKLASLRDCVRQIVLCACGVAKINEYQSWDGKGDGNRFCTDLARLTQAYVVASTETQWYIAGKEIDFGAWEGMVLQYAPNGNIRVVQEG